MIRYFLLKIGVLLSCSLLAQSKSTPYPQNYFRWPLSLKPEIVANMGELRSNHWHMGLDIRTNQKVNQLVYAAAEGYIAYAGIRPGSYGRFLIINHPNGLSTLYGHLNDFEPGLEAWVTEQQYAKESWAQELSIPADKFPVKKGSFIAYSGTTGGSQGPHVHFEIRDTKTDRCLNPLFFGMPLADNVKPSIVKLAMYNRSMSVYDQSPKFFALKSTAEGYVINKMPVLKTNLPKVSFALQAFDRMSGSQNQDGIYSAKIFVDEVLQVFFAIDSFDYNDTRYMNAQIDYKYEANGGPYIQHLSAMPGDNGPVYHRIGGDGVIELNDTEIHKVRIEIEDSYKNKSVLNFQLQYDDNGAARDVSKSEVPVFAPFDVSTLKRPDFEVMIPEAALYDTVRVFYYRSNSPAENAVSAAHQLNDMTIPLHTSLTVRIKPDRTIPDSWKDKLVIRRTFRNSTSVRKAILQGQWVTAEFGDFGTYQAFADLTPPSINELGRGDTINLSASNRIVFTPTDNFGISSFRAELNGQWLRFTNDKSRNWIYEFDERCPYGVHELKVTVRDIVGNVTTKSWWFKRYPYTPPPKKVVKKKGATKRKTTTAKKKSVTKKR